MNCLYSSHISLKNKQRWNELVVFNRLSLRSEWHRTAQLSPPTEEHLQDLSKGESLSQEKQHIFLGIFFIFLLSVNQRWVLVFLLFFPISCTSFFPAITGSYCADAPALIIVMFHCDVLDFIVNSVSTGRATTSTDTAAITFSSCYPLNLAFRSKRSHYLTNCHSLLFHFRWSVWCPSQDSLWMWWSGTKESICVTLS